MHVEAERLGVGPARRVDLRRLPRGRCPRGSGGRGDRRCSAGPGGRTSARARPPAPRSASSGAVDPRASSCGSSGGACRPGTSVRPSTKAAACSGGVSLRIPWPRFARWDRPAGTFDSIGVRLVVDRLAASVRSTVGSRLPCRRTLVADDVRTRDTRSVRQSRDSASTPVAAAVLEPGLRADAGEEDHGRSVGSEPVHDALDRRERRSSR